MNEYYNPKKEYINLADLPPNENGLISRINGGRGITGRLNSMGVQAGQTIEKICGSFLGGPVVFKIKNTYSIAVGHGIARKIILEYNKKNEPKQKL